MRDNILSNTFIFALYKYLHSADNNTTFYLSSPLFPHTYLHFNMKYLAAHRFCLFHSIIAIKKKAKSVHFVC